jgi:hypothetical protein
VKAHGTPSMPFIWLSSRIENVRDLLDESAVLESR